jgi:uncharacterized protein YciI
VATFIVERPTGTAWVAGVDTREQPLWDEHAAFMDALWDRGLIVLGGPLVGRGGDAVVVLEAASEAEVRGLLEPDPWVRDDLLRVGEIREWRLFFDVRA